MHISTSQIKNVLKLKEKIFQFLYFRFLWQSMAEITPKLLQENILMYDFGVIYLNQEVLVIISDVQFG